MTYDEGLAHRLRRRLDDEPGLHEKAMFGGLGFMLEGNMACGVIEESMIARVGPDEYEAALEEPHARPFDFTGREMRGWVYVDPAGLSEDAALEAWVDRCLAFVDTLAPK
ncbi:MAG: TfoX/Sxy family protein [Halobacteriales archaeon]|nr:TfoX/Sxy family protein [Halobacteriales archaeon]